MPTVPLTLNHPATMNDDKRQATLLRAFNYSKEIERSVDNVWTGLGGRIAEQIQRMNALGFDVRTADIIKGLRQRLDDIARQIDEGKLQ